MKRAHGLEARLSALQTLSQAVSAMKSLSGHHFRTVRQALEPARAYRDGIERVLAQTDARLPAGQGPVGLLVIGGELGFCGAYNTGIAQAGVASRQRYGPGPSFCVGARATLYLQRLGLTVDRAYPAPASEAGTTNTLLRLAQDILGDYVTHDCQRFVVLAQRFHGVGAFEPQETTLLPLAERTTPNTPRPRYVSRERLAGVAVRELLYITLVELLLEALASEHSARLVATQNAERWLDRQIERLRRSLHATRREASTQEVIEVAVGARARQRTLSSDLVKRYRNKTTRPNSTQLSTSR